MDEKEEKKEENIEKKEEVKETKEEKLEIKEEKKEEAKEIEKEVTKVEEEQERIYTIPLREAYNQPWTKRARKAVRIVKEFLQRHTKQEIKIGNDVNEEIWKRGMKHPPRKIRVIVKGGVANLVK